MNIFGSHSIELIQYCWLIRCKL